jgi:flagellar protein FlgJ
MSAPPVTPSYYADFSGLEGLKAGARTQQKDAVRETARQFESLLTRMMLKSMREASMGQSLGDSEATSFYQDMYDQQLAVQISKGEGLGLATRLVEQLVRSGAVRGDTAAVDGASSAAPASGGPPISQVSDAERQKFVEQIRPMAAQAAAQLGVAPEAVIAHAALETGWGRHVPMADGGSSFNLFGVKATAGGGAAVPAMTTEYSDGQPVQLTQDFRRYDSLQAGMADYASILGGLGRYASARNTGSDVQAFATGLQRGGYATDPAYAQKLVATAHSVRHYLGLING